VQAAFLPVPKATEKLTDRVGIGISGERAIDTQPNPDIHPTCRPTAIAIRGPTAIPIPKLASNPVVIVPRSRIKIDSIPVLC